MKLEFPSDERFTAGFCGHESLANLLYSVHLVSLEAEKTRTGSRPGIFRTWQALFLHPTVTDAIDDAILRVIRVVLDDERLFLQLGSPNKHAEIDKLLNDFLKSHRPTRAKKTAKQPTP